MVLDVKDKELKQLMCHVFVGKYKVYKSNHRLLRDLNKVIRYLIDAKSIIEVSKINSLHYEKLKGCAYSSVRIGYNTKYRLIFEENDDKITLILIEISEHYGDH